MPARDGTGPQGNGPSTGRGAGPCAGITEQESRDNDFQPGFGRGFRQRFGRSAGRGFGQRFGRSGRRFGGGRGWWQRGTSTDSTTNVEEQN
ncbi:MAG: DUF5320 domain-containing protein [Anaerolineales bacterium]|nr:DUF5320 domain-containing protein [Anaerolineales bacterium]